jgi:hypothetical protein
LNGNFLLHKITAITYGKIGCTICFAQQNFKKCCQNKFFLKFVREKLNPVKELAPRIAIKCQQEMIGTNQAKMDWKKIWKYKNAGLFYQGRVE